MHAEPTAELEATAVIDRDTDGVLLPGLPISEEYRHLDLPGFEFLSVLGRGGMGIVFLGKQTRLNRRVAIKMLGAKYAENAAYIERLEKEAQVLATLSHPNIVTCHDIVTSESGTFLIMQFIPGQLTIGGMLARFHVLPEPIALRMALEVARGLACGQDKGITHRDVKPDNLLFFWDREHPPETAEELYRYPQGRVAICDFGIAIRNHVQLDEAGKPVGSPVYMAPEQCDPEATIDHRADIYGLGVTLYHLVTGKIPFKEEDRESMFHRKCRENIPDPRIELPQISEECARIIQRMGRLHPDERYENYTDLITDLNRLVHLHDSAAVWRFFLKIPLFLRWVIALVAIFALLFSVSFGIFQLRGRLTMKPLSHSLSLGYWMGNRSGWQVSVPDAEMETAALTGSGDGLPLVHRQILTAGDRVEMKVRVPIQGLIQVSLQDEVGERLRISWRRTAGTSGLRSFADGREIPLPEIDPPESMEWLEIDFRIAEKRITLFVNGQLTSVIPLRRPFVEAHLALCVQRGNVAQFRDIYITKTKPRAKLGY